MAYVPGADRFIVALRDHGIWRSVARSRSFRAALLRARSYLADGIGEAARIEAERPDGHRRLYQVRREAWHWVRPPAETVVVTAPPARLSFGERLFLTGALACALVLVGLITIELIR